MEIEAKFIVPDEATLNRLREAEQFGSYERSESKVKQVHDRYVDTPDHRFYGQHFFVRLREGAPDGMRLLTVKRLGVLAQGAVHERDEFEATVPGVDVASWPEGEARKMVEEIMDGESLDELVVVNQRRTVSTLLHDGREVAELSLDEVEVPAAGGPLRAYELEVELLPDGTMSDLNALAQVFTDEYHLAPQPLSKFERALGLVTPNHEPHISESEPEVSHSGRPTVRLSPEASPYQPEGAEAQPPTKKRPMGVLPTDSMALAAKKVLRAHFGAMLDNEKGTREGQDPEALHDMRVATRRMRAALRIAEPYLPGKQARRVTDGVRSVTRALGAVRDLDVLMERAQEFRAGLPEEQQSDLDGLLSDWADRRERARKKMLRLLDSDDYPRLARRMESFLKDTEGDDTGNHGEDDRDEGDHGEEEEVLPVQVRHVIGNLIWARYEAVRAYETVMDAPTIPQLHMLRISGKYLRYTLEFFREVLPDNASALIRDVTTMQDKLGALHDADVAAGLARDYLAASSGKGKKKDKDKAEAPPGLLAYTAHLQGVVGSTKSDFASTSWKRITGHKWRAQLASAIAAV